MKRLLKKAFHKFVVNEKGAVSIYLIIVAVFLLLFNAVLIDFARIIVAERQTEEAAKVALRSSLAAYNTDLQNKGLFGLSYNQEEAESVFKEVFKKNLEGGDNYNLLGLKPVGNEISLNLNMERSLANDEILKYQILEEMKYKAPVEIGEALLKDFLSIAEHVQKASEYAEKSTELNKNAKTREEKLESVEELLEEAKKLLTEIESSIKDIDIEESRPDPKRYPEIKYIADIYLFHGRYLDEKKAISDFEKEQEDEDKDEDEDEEAKKEAEKKKEKIDQYKKDTKIFEETTVELLKNIIDKSEQAKEKLDEALVLVKEAEEINDKIIEIIKDPSKAEEYEKAKEASMELEENSGDFMDTLENYAMEEQFFTDLQEAIQTALDELQKEDNQTSQLIPKSVEFLEELKELIRNDTVDHNNFYRNVKLSRRYHKAAFKAVEQALDIVINDESRKEYQDSSKEAKEDEDKADEHMEKTEKTLEELEKEAKKYQRDKDTFKELNKLVEKYGGHIEENGNKFSFKDREKTSDEAFNFVDMLFESIGDKLLGARDKLYINEYILMRFQSHDFKANERYSYENNQVEYIIYGLNSGGANYAAAMSEIFAVRFAINLAAGLLEPRGKIFGPAMWAYALFFAFKQTVQDITDITDGRNIRIFPLDLGKKGGLVPTMNYKDHLRLFLFVHMEGKRFERLMAVLHYDTEQDLSERSTYVTAKATSTVNLWFLPQVIDMLGSTKAINGRVEGNTFYIEKEVHASY